MQKIFRFSIKKYVINIKKNLAKKGGKFGPPPPHKGL